MSANARAHWIDAQSVESLGVPPDSRDHVVMQAPARITLLVAPR